MESSRINYPSEVEQTVNSLLQAYVDAELAYEQAAANACSETVYLPNFARYFAARARELNYFRAQMMRYQTQRGGQVMMPAQHTTQYPFKPAKTVSEIAQVMQQFVHMEQDLQAKWQQFYQQTSSAQDVMSAHYAEHQLMQHQSRQYSQMVRFTNSLQQSTCTFFFDCNMMREAAEQKEQEDACDFFEPATEQDN